MPCGEPLRLVLLIEDDAETRESLRRALQQDPCIITAAANGTEALRFLEQDQPDAIVLDVNLPSLDGRDVLVELKSRGLVDRVPIIVIADSGELPIVQECACAVREAVDHDAVCAAVRRALAIVEHPRVSQPQPAPPLHRFTGIVCRHCKQPIAEIIHATTATCPACGYSWFLPPS